MSCLMTISAQAKFSKLHFPILYFSKKTIFYFFFLLSILQCLFPHKIHSVICRHDVPDQLYVDFGSAKQFSPVGCVSCNRLFSTGTLISPRTVLVSAHAITNNHVAIFSIFHPQKNKIIKVQGRAIRHEDYFKKTDDKQQIVSLFNDIGVVILDQAITGIEPAELEYEDVELNTVCFCAGYGKPGTGLTGPKHRDYTKRAFTNALDGMITDSNFDNSYAIIFSSPDDNVDITPLEGIGAEGDSGAPIFIYDSERDEYRVAGILTLLVMKGFYHSYNAVLPTANFSDWIEKNKY